MAFNTIDKLQFFIIYICNVATIMPLNTVQLKLPYSYPFWNASLPNEGHFANFCPKLVALATSLEESEKVFTYETHPITDHQSA